jgi:hypothetical protein
MKLIFLLFLITITQNANAISCQEAKKFTEKCTLTLDEIHPTQFVVGMISVNIKKIEIFKKYKNETLKKYLKKNGLRL